MAVKESDKVLSDRETYKTVDNCRVCSGSSLVPYLDLGNLPLVNRYLSESDLTKPEPKFPLLINYCTDCSMSQLSVVVDPEVLFSDYSYRSSVSGTFKDHCGKLAESAKNRFGLSLDSLVVDIASNDGCLINQFKKKGTRVLGIDPAKNLAEIANSQGLTTLPIFWNEENAKSVRSQHGTADLITGTNVFAHVHNLDSFLKGVNTLLDDNGVFMIEVPYQKNFMHKTEFDTAYHEHLSYFLVRPLDVLFRKHGLRVFDVEEFPIHGGSIRVYAKKEASQKNPVMDDKIQRILSEERDHGLHEKQTYDLFAHHVRNTRDELRVLLTGLKSIGKRIAAFGASAKGNVLLNYCGLGKETLDYVVDETPEKKGKYYPGNHIPIVPLSRLSEQRPDYLLILPWNFQQEIMDKTADFKQQGGRYVVPIPAPRIL